MVDISLQNVVVHGDFGPFWLGASKTELLHTVGEPDGPIAAHIWKFGDIEVMFGADDTVGCVNLHAFSGVPSGGKRVQLDPWIIKTSRRLEDVLQELARIGVRFRCEQPEWDTQQLHVSVHEKPLVYIDFLLVNNYGQRRGLHGLWMVTQPMNMGLTKLRTGVTRE